MYASELRSYSVKQSLLLQTQSDKNVTPIMFFMERPVQVMYKSQLTLLEIVLKIGGLLGFIRLFTMLMGFLHLRAFVKDLA